MRAMDRKLLRDVAHLWAQLAAVALVVACGVAALVTMRSNFHSLLASREAYYARYRFADVFAPLTRAPLAVARRAAAIPGVSVAEPRTVASVTLDVPGLSEPATALVVSLPAAGAASLNQVHVRVGRRPAPGARDEALVTEAFATANRLRPGDAVTAVLDGRLRTLRVVGVGLSPEFVYALGANGVFPDDRRYGVLWMDGEALAAAFDLEGAFNDLLVALAPGASEPAVLDALDRLLAPYGGVGAYGRDLQQSNRFLSDEIEQNRSMSLVVPAIFLGIATFLTHLVLDRLVTLQRDQIAVLRAFGYTGGAIGRHYVGMALVPVVAGAMAGVAFGVWAGRALAVYYTNFFHFPELTYVAPASVLAGAVLASAAAATAGAWLAARRAARLPPAEAMRPEPPARFHATVLERLGLQRALSPAARIIVRNLERRPLQSALTVLGIAMAVAILIVGYFAVDAVWLIADRQFRLVQREDVTVTFEGPRAERARHELARLPGVRRVEPFRAVSVQLSAGAAARRTALLGLDPAGELHLLVDADGHRVPLATGGLVLSRALAEILGVERGDTLRVAVLEGARPVHAVPVVQVVDELIGTTAYMARADLDRLAGGPRAVSGAFLTVDEAAADSTYAALKRIPAVSGVQVRLAMLRSFERTVAENLNVSIYTMVAFAAIIAFGVVYNAARVALSERGRELASLRVLGFTRREVGLMLLGEQALLTAVAIPVGFLLGHLLAIAIVRSMSTESFRLPIMVSGRTFALSALWITAAAAISALAVWRRVRRLDMIAVLKSRE